MSLSVTLYRHRLTLLALFALGALFMLFTRTPTTTAPSSSFKAPKYDENDIRWIQNRQRYAPPAPKQPKQPKQPEQPRQRNVLTQTPISSTRPVPTPEVVLPKKNDKPEPPKDNNAEQSDVEKKIRQLIRRNRVMVFSKTFCPYSRNTKQLLSQYRNDRGLEYEVLEADLESDPIEVKAVLGKISARFTFPNIFIDGQSIGGNDELRELHTSGELVALFGDKHLII
ncbi:hypothetical protein GGH12_000159 [Coemansia sp. RSA 1822]|nr:hypothetical protein LPJ76_000158 [Coemansia sp. RSA 638]KAJ2545899.1 hypothetical protein GGF49_000102 [Coemansia sp. RSA 1853]KAJ2567721.1 hypothetical protein GGH12_000159 [Coemansia sp. RSA 1822]